MPRHLARELMNGARALRRIDAGVGGDAAHRRARTRRNPCAPFSPRRRAATVRAPARASLRRASSSIAARDVPLPISSSVVHSMTMRRRERRRRPRAARASPACAMAIPAFMSKTPGPCSRPFEARQRHPRELADRPHRVEMTEQQDLRRAAAEFREEVIAALGPRQARDAAADRLEARCAARAPHRSTAALSVVGDSRPTSASIVSSSQAPLAATEIPQAYNRSCVHH